MTANIYSFNVNYRNIFHTFFYFEQVNVSLVALSEIIHQPAFTCSKLTKETLEQGVKYVQS